MPTTKTKHLLGVKFQYCDIVKIQLLSEEGATLKSFLRLISCSGLFSEARFLHKTISQTFTLLSADESELLQAMTTALAPIPKLYLRSAALAHQKAMPVCGLWPSMSLLLALAGSRFLLTVPLCS